MKPTAEQLRHELAIFTGTEHYYRHGLARNVVYTDGVQHFAESAGAYWFLDILATEPVILAQAKEFAVATLKVAGDKAVLSVTDGNDHEVYTRDISFTDCPPGEWQFYFIDGVILLPSEY